jgi:hypothetical protein
MFNENHHYYSLCMFFLEDYLELGSKPYIFCSDQDTLIAEWFELQIQIQINLLNLDTDLYFKNLLDHRNNIYNYGKRYLLKKHIHSKGLQSHG